MWAWKAHLRRMDILFWWLHYDFIILFTLFDGVWCSITFWIVFETLYRILLRLWHTIWMILQRRGPSQGLMIISQWRCCWVSIVRTHRLTYWNFIIFEQSPHIIHYWVVRILKYIMMPVIWAQTVTALVFIFIHIQLLYSVYDDLFLILQILIQLSQFLLYCSWRQ